MPSRSVSESRVLRHSPCTHRATGCTRCASRHTRRSSSFEAEAAPPVATRCILRPAPKKSARPLQPIPAMTALSATRWRVALRTLPTIARAFATDGAWGRAPRAGGQSGARISRRLEGELRRAAAEGAGCGRVSAHLGEDRPSETEARRPGKRPPLPGPGPQKVGKFDADGSKAERIEKEGFLGGRLCARRFARHDRRGGCGSLDPRLNRAAGSGRR